MFSLTAVESTRHPHHSLDRPDREQVRHWLEAWMPASCAVAVALADATLAVPDGDRTHVRNCVPARMADFVAGRWCAHQALSTLGVTAADLPVGPLGGPLWPQGFTGSITHDGGVCAAVVGPTHSLTSMGIDLCAFSRRDDIKGLGALLLSEREKSASNQVAFTPERLQLTFSAKEAVVKAASGLVNRFLDLQEMDITFHSNTFFAKIKGCTTTFAGCWTLIQGHALTFAYVRSDSGSQVP